MPGPTWLDYARLCAAVYEPDIERVPGGWRRTWFGVIGDGFKGGQFQRSSGGRIQLVCAYAGTDSLEDVLADVGFGAGSGLTLVATILSSRLRTLVGAGSRGLASQINFALELMQQARWAAGQQGALLYLTGHSLGGGLAALIAADTGEAAATISSPAVAHMPGVLARYSRNGPRIVNLEVDGDPINATLVLGNRLGTTRTIRTSRMAGMGHGIDGTVTDLSPGGVSSSVGAQIPL
jgi:hypothetical protein